MDLYEELVRLRRAGQKCALATIVQVNGSIPSYQSAKLLVRQDGSMLGTIGGGCVEAEVWNAAREVIETEKPRYMDFSLSQDAAYENGLICGGQLHVYIEPVIPQPQAYIFGAGHVSKSLAKAASLAGFSVIVIDDREQFANRERFPTADEVVVGDYEQVLDGFPVGPQTYIVLVTRAHTWDVVSLRRVIRRPAAYIGMIGSRRRVFAVFKLLHDEGVPLEDIARVHAPIGLDIETETPAEIAISIAAEIIKVRRGGGAPSLSDHVRERYLRALQKGERDIA